MGAAPSFKPGSWSERLSLASALCSSGDEEKREGHMGFHHRTNFMFQKNVLLFWFCVIITLDGRETRGLPIELREYESSRP